MLKFVILVFLVTWCQAAPTSSSNDDSSHRPQTLDRPAPINPDIPSDPKPAERVTLIGESSKIKRESDPDNKEPAPTLPGPITLKDPEDQTKQPNKRESDCHEHKVPKRESEPKPTSIPKDTPDDVKPVKRETNQSPDTSEKNKDVQTNPDPHKPDNPETHPKYKRETERNETTNSTKGNNQPKESHHEMHTTKN